MTHSNRIDLREKSSRLFALRSTLFLTLGSTSFCSPPPSIWTSVCVFSISKEASNSLGSVRVILEFLGGFQAPNWVRKQNEINEKWFSCTSPLQTFRSN